MVCKPADRSERWKVAASPMVPSRSNTHRRLAVTSPSSLSLALPVKVMLTSWLNVAPSVGALIVAVGGWLPGGITVIVTSSLTRVVPAGKYPARPDRPSQSETTPVCSTYHTVRWGESLFRIGLQYNLTWKPIASANNLSNPNHVFAGQVLCIPNVAPTSTWQYQKSKTPTFEMLSVVRNKRVTIQTNNFPPHMSFVVTMGRYGTKTLMGSSS